VKIDEENKNCFGAGFNMGVPYLLSGVKFGWCGNKNQAFTIELTKIGGDPIRIYGDNIFQLLDCLDELADKARCFIETSTEDGFTPEEHDELWFVRRHDDRDLGKK